MTIPIVIVAVALLALIGYLIGRQRAEYRHHPDHSLQAGIPRRLHRALDSDRRFCAHPLLGDLLLGDLRTGDRTLAFGLRRRGCGPGRRLARLAPPLAGLRARNKVELIIRIAMIAASTITILTTFGIVFSLLFEALRFFTRVPVFDFLFGMNWSPQTAIRSDQVGSSGSFGAIPLMAGTLLITVIAMGITIIPFVSSLSDDVMNSVPQTLRDGSFALGATKSETTKQILPAALPGIVGAVLLAASRAIGETMIVVMAAGLAANLTANPLEAVTTITVQIATLLVDDQEFDSAKTLSTFALGLLLFTVTLALNFALRIVAKYREKYD